MPYRSLKAEYLIERVEQIQRRIHERFPERNLNHVCAELLGLTREAQDRATWIAQPLIWLRLTMGALAAFVLIVFGSTIWLTVSFSVQFSLADFVQFVEAGLNAMVLIGAGFFFLFTTERRMKQKRTLAALHELRSIAHLIDMHQLAKDPEHVIGKHRRTASSPRVGMTLFELTRYLDYCSEMLAMIGKVAALYVQEFDDDIAVAAVNELEELTTGLSRKIWQKIMVVNNIETAIEQKQQLEIARR